jgi:hypothetical protein
MTRRQAVRILNKHAERLGGGAALARELGCSRSFASLLLADRRNPGRRLALSLLERCEIPIEVWDEKAA